ncbi:MAG: PEP-CTERM sorting domain-containing protein [Planctomycetes bacterium]|nr:PEP-CTERM sorting domain-containing protein [Planctomycetota bacterium]
MLKKLLAGVVATGALSAAACADLTIRVTAADGYGPIGGEFNLTAVGLDFVPVGLTNEGYWESFCLEKNESIAFGFQYYAAINTAAVNGGLGGGNPDPLDPRSAYLYELFITGTLPDYVYDTSDGGTARTLSADDLQSVIWFIEEEEAMSWTPGDNSRRDQWYQLAASNAGETIGDVRVVNLYEDAQGTIRGQDQIVLTPEPSSLVLLALGAAASLRRRVR